MAEPQPQPEPHTNGSIEIEALRHRYDQGPATDVLDGVTLEIEAGSTLSLLGPSGCGKTTLLRAIAGLERPHAGTIRVDGQVLVGPSHWVPPERRQIGLVFQEWALFPHRNVAGNVGYGLGRAGRAERVAETLAMVGLSGFQDRLPSTLSGGQQQRVAVARALAPQPRVLLLDEPFSNLDAGRRVEMRADLRSLLDHLGITAIFVTHDQEEAFIVGRQVALMDQGQIIQVGAPHDLYRHPVSRWAADFVGETVIVNGHASGRLAVTAWGPIILTAPNHGPVDVVIRPEQLRLAEAEPDQPQSESRRFLAHGTVDSVEYHGHDALVRVAVHDRIITVRTGPDPVGQPGQPVAVTLTGSALAFAREPNRLP